MQILQSLQALYTTDHPITHWQRLGLPTPASWQIPRAALAQPQALLSELDSLAAAQPQGHYWVLQQGRMNATSQRQSLVNLDGSRALLNALEVYFRQDNDQDHDVAVVQLLPGRKAAGVLFTRHPLRQDLDHLVVEGVCDEAQPPQRLIFQADGRLVFRSQAEINLDTLVPSSSLLALTTTLKQAFDKPQAAEWVYDGEQLWLLQTLPIGSLPEPREAWSCRVADGFWPQVVTPLWYTLESRWLKNRFWEPLVAQANWHSLHKVEPYRRQHSHIYRNSQFFRQLAGFTQALPPAWREAQARQTEPLLKPLGWLPRWLLARQLKQVQRRLDSCVAASHWQRLLKLDLLGEELAVVSGNLHYRVAPLLAQHEPTQTASLPPGVRDWLAGQSGTLRAGMDPIHAFMRETPPEVQSLAAADARLNPLLQWQANGSWQGLQFRCDALRERLADALHHTLGELGTELARKGQLPHAEDIHFCYFDELWRLCEQHKLPQSLADDVLGKRKLRYLEDAHIGAPDWKLDQLGFGFNQDLQAHELLLGKPAVAGQAQGPIRRLVSSWVLNQVMPGEILVMHQCDVHWLPWLTQAAGLIVATHQPQNAVVELAKALNIPCVYALDDAMHCLADGQQVTLDADAGRVTLVSA